MPRRAWSKTYPRRQTESVSATTPPGQSARQFQRFQRIPYEARVMGRTRSGKSWRFLRMEKFSQFAKIRTVTTRIWRCQYQLW